MQAHDKQFHTLMAKTVTHSATSQRLFLWWCSQFSRQDTSGYSYAVIIWTTFILLGLFTPAAGDHPLDIGGHFGVDQDTRDFRNGICKSMDIRNSVDQFEVLRGCRVVEGFVQIILFDSVNETLFTNISFPELIEITDYLLLYRVNGLRSVGQLFPNLAVIRGQKSFFGFAFIVFEMSSLQEIGLYSLTDIVQGLVRIDKNPSLCFVNSIDWELIAHERGDHFIQTIKPENECPICSSVGIDNEAYRNISTCPLDYRKGNTEDFNAPLRRLCWNMQKCQKVCPKICSSCDDHGDCCESKCLGGCNNNVCTVCRNFTSGGNYNKKCIDSCPQGFFEHLGRRCLRREECIGLKRPLDLVGKGIQQEYPYKIFGNLCVLQCPTNHMDDFGNHECVPCAGKCKKECPSANIDSLASAQLLRGCTHIKGSLEIQIRGGNVVNELEDNLNMIEEIDGYIKIVRSFPLVSLNFLRNLRVIHGNTLESQKYVFVVLDNQNLQDLWNWENRSVTIEKGRLFFHFNPKLCYSKIQALREKAGLSQFTELEVAPSSNGDKMACNVVDMPINISQIESKGVILNWEPFDIDDQRKLLGYVVYSIEAPSENITLYDGRDACGGDGWRVDDVGINQEENNGTVTLTYILTHLKPYTQYAFYVKTYTVATEQSGAQSRIYYFRTLPDVPSKPVNLQVITNSSNSLYITWNPPQQSNGNIAHYIVSGQQHRELHDDLLSNRNYCHDPPSNKQPIPVPPVTITVQSRIKNDTCSCDDDMRNSGNRVKIEKEIMSQINFEDELHNQVYIKKERNSNRHKRLANDHNHFPIFDQPSILANNSIKNITDNATGLWDSFSYPVYDKLDLYVGKLHHFTVYNIYVLVCRQIEGEHDVKPSCSDISIKTARTQHKPGADKVTSLRVSNKSSGMVTLTWDEPLEPNGLILTYQIEYRRMDIENSKPILECITRKLFISQHMVYSIYTLNTGNYSVRLMATSQAGNGDYSDFIYFLIEESTAISSTHIFLYIFAALVTLILLTGIIVFAIKKRFGPPIPPMKLITSINPEYISSVYVPDEWEVSRKKIELMKELGQGSFGMVYEGIVRDFKGKPEVRCAVKTVNEHATNRERVEFLNEASVMKAFDTAYVVRLLGVVSQGQPTLVIMELMAHGDLKSYLRSHRPDADTYTGRQPPLLKRILQMAAEIADGMAYLAAKKFVHRDLAARNCMVAEDLTVKIGDFGMTRDIYETDYYRKGTKGLLPVRWMAPESLKDGVFSTGSDAWSYGIVLWEMATLASQPYQGLSNDQVLRYVIDGGVMERPENCPDKLYNLMRLCWHHKPNSRPTFLELTGFLVEDATPHFSRVSFYHSLAGMEARNAVGAIFPSQDDATTPLKPNRDLDEHFSMGSSEGVSDVEVGTDTRINFPSFSQAKDAPNGYVSGHPVNIVATTHC